MSYFVCRFLLKVEEQQHKISFGPGYVDVEVDEVTLCKYEVADPKKPIAWISYIGMMQRGRPDSLALHQLPTKTTSRKSPGPGPRPGSSSPSAISEARTLSFTCKKGKGHQSRAPSLLESRVFF